MAESDFTMVLDGSALDDHLIPVRDLAPALLALGEMFHDANRLLHPPESGVTLSIRATDSGSFEVHLVLTTVADWSTLFNSDEVHALLNLKELIVAAGIGVFWLIQRIRKRPIASQEPSPTEPGRTIITLADGTVIDAPSDTVRFYNETRTKRLAAEVVAPLERDGIDRIGFEAQDIQTTVSIGAEDADAFAPDPGDLAHNELVNTEEGSVALTLEVVPLIEGQGWRVNDGDSSHRARMADDAFTERVVHQGETFTAGDYLLARVRRDQYRNVDTGRLHSDWTITEVLRHAPAVPPGEQLELRAPDPPASGGPVVDLHPGLDAELGEAHEGNGGDDPGEETPPALPFGG